MALAAKRKLAFSYGMSRAFSSIVRRVIFEEKGNTQGVLEDTRIATLESIISRAFEMRISCFLGASCTGQ